MTKDVSANEMVGLQQAFQIDEQRVQSHLDQIVRGTVEETLNALLDAEADRLCGAERDEAATACSTR